MAFSQRVPGADEIDLFNLMSAVWRGRGLVVLLVSVCAVIGRTYAYLQPDIYDARSKVLFQPSELVLSNVTTTPIDELRRMESEVQIAQGEEIVLAVLDELNLYDDERLELPASALDVLINRIVDQPEQSDQPPLSTARLKRFLESSVVVRQMGRSTLIAFEARTFSPSLSAEISNAFAENYIKAQVQSKIRAALEGLRLVNEALEEAGVVLEQSQVALRDHIVKKASTISQRTGDAGIALLAADLDAARILVGELSVARRAFETLLTLANFDLLSAELNRLAGTNLLAELRAKAFADVNQRRIAVAAQLEANPGSAEIRDRLSALEAELSLLAKEQLTELINRTAAAQERQGALRGQLESAVFAADLPPDIAAELFKLQSDAESARDRYVGLVDLARELTVESRTQVADSRIVARATVPTEPTGPGWVRTFMLAASVGLVLAVGLLLLRSALKGPIYSTVHLQRTLQVPRVSVIMKVPTQNTLLDMIPRNPFSPYAESLRRISREIKAAFLAQHQEGDVMQGMVVVLTSSVPNEGKTTTAVGLAALNAMAGQSVCLLDLALRDSTLSQALNLSPNLFFSGFLTGAVEEPSQSTLMLNDKSTLTVITGSPFTGVDAEAPQVTRRLRELLDDLRSRFDVVIVDTSPILSATEALTITRMGDVPVFIVREAFAPRQAVEEAWQELGVGDPEIEPIVALSFVKGRPIKHTYAHTTYGSGAGVRG